MHSVDATPWTDNSVLKDSHLLSRYPDLGINRQEFSLMESEAGMKDLPFKTPLINVPKRNDELLILGASNGFTAHAESKGLTT